MVNVYQRTIFEANIMINGRYNGQKFKSTTAVAAIMDLVIVEFSATQGNHDIANFYQQTAWLATGIYPKIQTLSCRPPPASMATAILNFDKSVFFGINYATLVWQMWSGYEIWWKSAEKWLRYTCLYLSKMAAVLELFLLRCGPPRHHSWWATFSLSVV